MSAMGVTPLEKRILHSIDVCHEQDLAKLTMQLVLYRKTLEDHGIEPPDKSGEELLALWRKCQRVISTASEFVVDLGSAKELLA